MQGSLKRCQRRAGGPAVRAQRSREGLCSASPGAPEKQAGCWQGRDAGWGGLCRRRLPRRPKEGSARAARAGSPPRLSLSS